MVLRSFLWKCILVLVPSAKIREWGGEGWEGLQKKNDSNNC